MTAAVRAIIESTLDDRGLAWEKTGESGYAVTLPGSHKLKFDGGDRYEKLEQAVEIAIAGPVRPKYDCTNQATEKVLWVVA